MNNKDLNATNKKAGKGNGNSVINNKEQAKSQASNYVSGDSPRSSSSHTFNQNSNS